MKREECRTDEFKGKNERIRTVFIKMAFFAQFHKGEMLRVLIKNAKGRSVL